MSRSSTDHAEPGIESLLSTERVPVAAPRESLHRALKRARVALHEEEHSQVVRVGRRARDPRRVFKLIAIPVALGASWAFAHRAGYRVQLWDAEDSGSKDQRAAQQGLGEPGPGQRSVDEESSTEGGSVQDAIANTPPAEPAAATAQAAPSAVNPSQQEPKAAFKSNNKPETDDSTRELRMLQLAQRAVARREYAEALVRISEHRQAFPSGALAEEREALRIKALVGLGKAGEARRAAGDFQKKFPNSALHGRIHVPAEAAK